MTYFQSDYKIRTHDLLRGVLTDSQLKKVKNNFVADIAYDSLSLHRFPTLREGVKIYFSPYPFVNRDGKEQNPNLFINEAIKYGANIIIYKPFKKLKKKKNIIYIENNNPRQALAQSSFRFYQFDKIKIPIFGVTGTKGKTTISYLLYHLLSKIDGKTGLISSADYYIGNQRVSNLSPHINGTWLSCLESLELAGFIYNLYKQGGKAMVIEATSHALALYRISNKIHFIGGIITNIGSDHLDFHKTRTNYIKAKKMLIDYIAMSKIALFKVLVLNANDSLTLKLIDYAKKQGIQKIVLVGIEGEKIFTDSVDYLIRDKDVFFEIIFNKNVYKCTNKLGGSFNAFNYTAAIALINQVYKIPVSKLIDYLFLFKKVPGRFEFVIHNPYSIIVDYAHEESSMRAVLKYARSHWKKVFVVFSCTGDRDPRKRPKMGKIASKFANYSIVTNDSAHSEDPCKILNDIAAGFQNDKFELIDDRYLAIKKGMSLLKPDDDNVLLILGMGNENIMEKDGIIHKWSDKIVVQQILNNTK